MYRRLMASTALLLAVTMVAPAAFANPAQGAGAAQAASVRLDLPSRLAGLQLSIQRLTELRAQIAAEAQAEFDLAAEMLAAHASAEAGTGGSTSMGADAVARLQVVMANPALSASARAKLEGLVANLTEQLELRAETVAEAEARVKGKPAETDLTRANAAREAAALRLQAMLDANASVEPDRALKIEAVVAKLMADLVGGGKVESEQQALAAIEAAVEADPNPTVAELDVKAEAEAKQGKKAEARATLAARLEANPHTRTAYERLIGLETEAGAHQELDTYVLGKKVDFDVRPMIKENRTLVPIRALVESLGAEVKWNAETRVVTITKGSNTIELKIDSKVAVVGGVEMQLEAPAQIEGNRTVVPVRFISEGLGLYVKWLAQHRTILVTEEPVAEE